MTDMDKKFVNVYGSPFNYYVILRQKTQHGQNYYRRGVVINNALSAYTKHKMQLTQGSIVYYDKGRVLSIDKGIRYIAVKPSQIILVKNQNKAKDEDTPFNLYTIIKRQINKHGKYHRSGICIATDAQQRQIKPGLTIYYDYGRIIMVKNGIQHIAIPQKDLVLSGMPKD